MRKKFVCDVCGSDEVVRDAWAEWDVDTQKWVLADVFDFAHCNACNGDCHTIAVPLQQEEEHAS